MNKIIYSTTDLFKVTGPHTIIVSTVCLRPLQDVSGELETIKDIYLPAYKDYVINTELYRKQRKVNKLLGRSYWFGYDSCKQKISLIYVSRKYGKWQDPLIGIRRRTISGLEHLLSNLPSNIEIHCNKLNVNKFGVPWINTLKDINELLNKYPKHKFVVHK